MGERGGTLALIYRYVPKVLMSKTYIHVSNSCRQASTGNITVRDLSKAQGDTDWYLALLSKTRCVAWTLENVPAAEKQGRYKYIKYVEFAMRSTSIDGVFSPLASYISSGRVTMRIFNYINRSAILFYSYYVLEASSQSFVGKSYGANKCVSW